MDKFTSAMDLLTQQQQTKEDIEADIKDMKEIAILWGKVVARIKPVFDESLQNITKDVTNVNFVQRYNAAYNIFADREKMLADAVARLVKLNGMKTTLELMALIPPIPDDGDKN